jgi:hypothetical protein
MDKQAGETGRANEDIALDNITVEMAMGAEEATRTIANEADDAELTAETKKTTVWRFNVSGWIRIDSRLKPKIGCRGDTVGFSLDGGEDDSDAEYSPAFGIYKSDTDEVVWKDSEMGKIGVELIDYDNSGCSLEEEGTMAKEVP